MTDEIVAKFGLGQIVRHREAAFRGVVIDVDPVFAGKPGDTGVISPDQPFYQVLALGAEGGFVAYAPEDALEHDPELATVTREAESRWFTVDARGRHAPKTHAIH
ncbi:heat shock protein HspQ [Brevundimonas sp.]|uniref:heat shock protein HspQ n=1 Tax=Brevundimonas sp. TaxID=1871086 RepID=UPI002D619435|nr:heat shock protein HspQ [Brevundimonas sp.]HYC67938.1 heat shock protein HspQ [Brevundimonas sp.]